jgi:hypothetical protein
LWGAAVQAELSAGHDVERADSAYPSLDGVVEYRSDWAAQAED